jgi:hypothetical protein
VDPLNRFQDIGAFWDELEAAAGHTTPRITVTQGFVHDSMPPPVALDGGQPSSLLTEMDATKRLPGGQPFPELTLGLPTPGAPKAMPAKAKPPASSRGKGQVAFDEGEDDGMRISVMHGDAHEQLKSAGQGSSGSRAASPELAISSRVARTANVRALPSEAPTMDSVLARMMPALRLIALGVAIMIADVAYATTSGEAFRVGPVRALWIAGPLVGYGVVKLVLSLVS